MDKTAHTPGPWIEFADQGETVAILPAGREGQICDFASTVASSNARLIAAAPDMFDALQAIMSSPADDNDSWMEQAFTAWRKAGGRP
jgi:hypothetical protein